MQPPQEGVDYMTFKSPFQPELFYDSIEMRTPQVENLDSLESVFAGISS